MTDHSTNPTVRSGNAKKANSGAKDIAKDTGKDTGKAVNQSLQKPMRKATGKCSLCSKPKSDEFAPFCSRGCRDRDLNKWLSDGYAVPGPAVSPDELAPED